MIGMQSRDLIELTRDAPGGRKVDDDGFAFFNGALDRSWRVRLPKGTGCSAGRCRITEAEYR